MSNDKNEKNKVAGCPHCGVFTYAADYTDYEDNRPSVDKEVAKYAARRYSIKTATIWNY